MELIGNSRESSYFEHWGWKHKMSAKKWRRFCCFQGGSQIAFLYHLERITEHGCIFVVEKNKGIVFCTTWAWSWKLWFWLWCGARICLVCYYEVGHTIESYSFSGEFLLRLINWWNWCWMKSTWIDVSQKYLIDIGIWWTIRREIFVITKISKRFRDLWSSNGMTHFIVSYWQW